MTTATKPIIGIAGGIGAGKSAVARALADLGCLVVHSDDLGREALRDPAVRAELVDWWGAGVLGDDGEIDRPSVAKIVFADPQERRRLENLTHPWIEARRRALFAAAGPDVPALVIDAPLLFEAGVDAECTHIIFVDTPREVRLERITAARGWDDAMLRAREESQDPLDVKRRRADHVVRNDGDLPALSQQVRQVLHEIISTIGTTRESENM